MTSEQLRLKDILSDGGGIGREKINTRPCGKGEQHLSNINAHFIPTMAQWIKPLTDEVAAMVGVGSSRLIKVGKIFSANFSACIPIMHGNQLENVI